MTYICRPNACVCRYKSVYTAKVPEVMKGRFSALKSKVWNESHIAWRPFQTSFFTIYKVIYGSFSKTHRNHKGKPKIHYK